MNPNEAGRYRDPSMLILLSLSEDRKHGYRVMEDIKSNYHIEFSPGTLYGALSRLVKAELIIPDGTDERRVPYKITPAGVELLRRHIASLREFVSVGSERLERIGR